MPRCADPGCGRWRPELLAPRWASGVRFNGRFRLGFGAVLVRKGPEDPVISALTEFQAVLDRTLRVIERHGPAHCLGPRLPGRHERRR